MTKITPLNGESVTPELLIQYMGDVAGSLKEIYAVGVDQQGQLIIWSSGSMEGTALAILALQDVAFKQMNGLLDHGGGGLVS